jgi:hypothetical protein
VETEDSIGRKRSRIAGDIDKYKGLAGGKKIADGGKE